MQRSESINELAAALAAARADFLPIERNREVNAGTYTYTYATLDAILAAVTPALSRHGLALVQSLETSDAGFTLVTMIAHRSGQYTESTASFAGGGVKMQELGSRISYARRYAITTALCVAPEEDDDGSAADGRQVGLAPKATKAQHKPAPAPTTAKDKWTRAWDKIREQVAGSKGTTTAHLSADNVTTICTASGWTQEALRDIVKAEAGIDLGMAPWTLYEPLLWVAKTFDAAGVER